MRNIAGELAALYQALLAVKPGTALTIVHDYAGLGGWMTGTWKAQHPSVRALLARCHETAAARRLTLTFRHQPGHQADVTDQNEWIRFNQRADRLATQATAG